MIHLTDSLCIDDKNCYLITYDRDLPAPQNRTQQRLADVKAEQLAGLTGEQLDVFMHHMARDPLVIEEQLPTRGWYTWKYLKDLHLEMQYEYSIHASVDMKNRLDWKTWLR